MQQYRDGASSGASEAQGRWNLLDQVVTTPEVYYIYKSIIIYFYIQFVTLGFFSILKDYILKVAFPLI